MGCACPLPVVVWWECWLSALLRATFDLLFLPVFPEFGLAVVLGYRRGGWVVFQVPGFLTDYPSCGCLGDISITRLLHLL